MSSTAARAVALIRMAAGAIFVALGYSKITGTFVKSGFETAARDMASKSWPFWGGFLRSVVIPGAPAVAWIIALGEVAIGIGLLLGLWTRVASYGGAVLVLAILLGQSYAPGGSWAGWVTAGGTTKFTVLLLLLLGVVNAGKVWGLDGRERGSRRAIRS
jgi:thiosulfate dehydrogenase [quinone] large subunit